MRRGVGNGMESSRYLEAYWGPLILGCHVRWLTLLLGQSTTPPHHTHYRCTEGYVSWGEVSSAGCSPLRDENTTFKTTSHSADWLQVSNSMFIQIALAISFASKRARNKQPASPASVSIRQNSNLRTADLAMRVTPPKPQLSRHICAHVLEPFFASVIKIICLVNYNPQTNIYDDQLTSLPHAAW